MKGEIIVFMMPYALATCNSGELGLRDRPALMPASYLSECDEHIS
jgi:hypothetical protein